VLDAMLSATKVSGHSGDRIAGTAWNDPLSRKLQVLALAGDARLFQIALQPLRILASTFDTQCSSIAAKSEERWDGVSLQHV
jgi:hypothetical protein